jgi:hypothetical protein
MEQREIARQREARLREAEDLHIARIREEMDSLRGTGMEPDLLSAALRGLSSQISEILAQRAEREQIAMERELQQKKADMEERRRENEERAEEKRAENATAEELEQMRERALTRGIVTMSARADNIAGLRRTRATLAVEAGQLSRDIENSYGPVVVHDMQQLIEATSQTQETIDPVIWANVGRANPNDFRNRQLRALQGGIARLDTAILGETASLYRDSQALQESQLRTADHEPTPELDEEL